MKRRRRPRHTCWHFAKWRVNRTWKRLMLRRQWTDPRLFGLPEQDIAAIGEHMEYRQWMSVAAAKGAGNDNL